MNRILLIKLVLLASAAAGLAQTNSLTVTNLPTTNFVFELPPAARSDKPLQPAQPPDRADAAPKLSLSLSLEPAEPPTAVPTASRPDRLFPLPEAKWLDLPVKIQPAQPPSTHTESSASLNWNQKQELFEAAQLNKLVQNGLFIPQDDDDEFDRAMNAAFRPEIIHIGHLEICTSITTAIARRNPLCLLNPTPIAIGF